MRLWTGLISELNPDQRPALAYTEIKFSNFVKVRSFFGQPSDYQFLKNYSLNQCPISTIHTTQSRLSSHILLKAMYEYVHRKSVASWRNRRNADNVAINVIDTCRLRMHSILHSCSTTQSTNFLNTKHCWAACVAINRFDSVAILT